MKGSSDAAAKGKGRDPVLPPDWGALLLCSFKDGCPACATSWHPLPPNLHPPPSPLFPRPPPHPDLLSTLRLESYCPQLVQAAFCPDVPLPPSIFTVRLYFAAWGFFVLFSPLSRFCLAKELGEAGGSPWKQNSLSASLSVTAPSSSSSGHHHWIYRCESPCW